MFSIAARRLGGKVEVYVWNNLGNLIEAFLHTEWHNRIPEIILLLCCDMILYEKGKIMEQKQWCNCILVGYAT